MCLAIPGKVIEIDGEDVVVDYEVEKREVKNLMEELEVGDYVIVSNKIVIKKIPKEEALLAIDLIKTSE